MEEEEKLLFSTDEKEYKLAEKQNHTTTGINNTLNKIFQRKKMRSVTQSGDILYTDSPALLTF